MKNEISAGPAPASPFPPLWRWAIIVVAFGAGLAARFVCGWGAPLWFDETYSGVIASQPTVAGLVGWCLHELTGPAFYMPLWAWEKLAGSSDVALRFPSIVASLATPVLLLWRGHPDRDIRLLWAVLAALWVPGIVLAGDARPYSPLFLLGSIQAIVFLRLMRTPRVTTALVWSSVSVLMVLTHYHSAVVTGVQGLMYLALHRRAALRSWPALAPLVPMAAWMALHLPFVLGFASTGAWYETLDPRDVAMVPYVLFGSEIHGALILAVILFAVLAGGLFRAGARPIRWATPEALLALSGVVAFVVIFGMAFVRPSFTIRYLTSAMPALLFGIAVWGRWTLRARGTIDFKPLFVVFAILMIMVIGQMRLAIGHPERDFRRQFNFERASQWLLERPPARLIFFWDSSASTVSDPRRLAEVGGFFLARAGHPAVTTVPTIPANRDPNAFIEAATANDPGVAVLWTVTDHGIEDESRYPHLARHRDWECRNFGGGTTIVVACRRPV